MIHRVFCAINLPTAIKEKLFFYQREIEDSFGSLMEEGGVSPIRWTKKDNLHITLVFLGNTSDQEIAEICQTVKKATQNKEPFSIHLNKICLGPPLPAGQAPNKAPRMVWVEGEKSQELADIQTDLEKTLFKNFTPGKGGTGRNFRSHLSLGRIRQWQWQQYNPEEMPEIEKEISLSFEVDSIEIMESILKPRGPEYIVLETCNL